MSRTANGFANARSVLTIFFMVASLALVATLVNTQTASAITFVPAKRCELVKIITPKDLSMVDGLTKLQGYAKYGYMSNGFCNGTTVPGSSLVWYVAGIKVGNGNIIYHEFNGLTVCGGVFVTLEATIPTPSEHKIQQTIKVKGPYPC
jgi:hypothetical protein